MFSSIEIDGFRGIDGIKIKNAKKFNLIVGPNSSGKSSFIEAMFINCAPLNMVILLNTVAIRNGGILGNARYIFERIKWLFTNPQNKSDLKFVINSVWKNNDRLITANIQDYSIDSQHIQEIGIGTSTTLSSDLINKKNATQESYSTVSIGKIKLSFKNGKKRTKFDEFTFSDKQELTFGPSKIRTDIPAKFISSYLHKTPDAGTGEWDLSIKKGYDLKCLNLIQKIDPSIQDIRILFAPSKQPELYAKLKVTGFTPISNLGDGTRRAQMLAGSMVQCENGVLLIDELESGFHTNALKNMMKWITDATEDMNIQTFATTHSIECIDAVLESYKDKKEDLALFKLTGKNGIAKCTELSGEQLESLRFELGQDVRW